MPLPGATSLPLFSKKYTRWITVSQLWRHWFRFLYSFHLLHTLVGISLSLPFFFICKASWKFRNRMALAYSLYWTAGARWVPHPNWETHWTSRRLEWRRRVSSALLMVQLNNLDCENKKETRFKAGRPFDIHVLRPCDVFEGTPGTARTFLHHLSWRYKSPSGQNI